MSFFATSANPRGGSWRPRGRGRGVSIAGAGGRRGRQDVARLPEHEHGRREDQDRQRPRVQLQGRADCRRTSRTCTSANKTCFGHAFADRKRDDHRTIWHWVQPLRAPVAQPLQHDILTGTNEDGTKNADTCRDWTVGNADAKAMLGHADRPGTQRRRELVECGPPVAGLRPGAARADWRRRTAGSASRPTRNSGLGIHCSGPRPTVEDSRSPEPRSRAPAEAGRGNGAACT